jgi:serine/threonine-protein kinase
MASRRFPERVGRYDLFVQLGVGATASVYLGRAIGAGGFERAVAIKLLHPHLAGDSTQRTFLEEARIAAGIRHANVVSVTDVGEDGGEAFSVMDYVEGETLSNLCRLASPERLPIHIALRIVLDMLAGLHAAHELRGPGGRFLGLVHRDVTPHNVLVGVDGTTRLSDFGIAKVVGAASARTRTGDVKGKPAYMSPEQARGLPLDRRSDVWSAAVVAWELFAGVRLFPAGEDATTLLQIVSFGAPRLRTAWPEAPAILDDILAEALASNLDARLPTAEALRAELQRADFTRVAEPSEVGEYVAYVAEDRLEERRRGVRDALAARAAAPAQTSTPAPPPVRSGKRGWIAGALAAAALAAVGGAWFLRPAARAAPSTANASPPSVDVAADRSPASTASAEPAASSADAPPPAPPPPAPTIAAPPGRPSRPSAPGRARDRRPAAAPRTSSSPHIGDSPLLKDTLDEGH